MKYRIANNANMELKNITPNSNNIVKLEWVHLWKIVKIEKIVLKTKHPMLFFLQDAMIVAKQNYSYFSTSLISLTNQPH
jgi:hypothetical protein